LDFFNDIISKITTINLTIPLWEVLFIVIISTLFMLMGRFRFVLLILYAMSFVWIFLRNESTISKILTTQPQFTFGFILCGVLLLGLSVWSFFIDGD
jgi:hypothetical protein